MSPPSKPHDRWVSHDVPFVTEDGNAFGRYRVESRSGEAFHIVDLTDRGGLGACDCIDFQTRAAPNYRRIGEWIPYAPGRQSRSDCAHLEAAKAHFYAHVTVPMLAKMRHGVEAPKP